jgi:UDP-N-acetyl-2-amino-2-deoxyglucuronate dehydrogenase
MVTRFALLGCGRISSKHATALSGEVPDAKLVAVCDIVPEKAKNLGVKHGVRWFSDFHQMMREMGSEIDVVNVLTPSGMHADHAVDVAKYRKHVVVEKPMALHLDDADRMIRACDEAGVRLFVVKQNRFNLPVQSLRKALEQGRFGKLVMGTVRVRWCREQKYYDQDSWRGTWALDGGVFSNQASHHVDLLEWMMGDVESVFAKSATQLVNIEAEDTGIAVLRFRNGALGVIEATTATRPVDLEGSISVMGERGTVEIAGFAVNQMKIWKFAEQRPEDAGELKVAEAPPNVYGFGHVAYLRNVVESLRNQSKGLVDGLEGRRSLELISAIYESIETGKEVFLRFHPKHCRLGQPTR